MAERPTPEAVFKRLTVLKPTVFFGAPTGFAGMLASESLPSRSDVKLRLCSSAGEALPRDLGQRLGAHFACDIIDGIGSTEMLHIKRFCLSKLMTLEPWPSLAFVRSWRAIIRTG
jgi:benzoate-CoA ligase